MAVLFDQRCAMCRMYQRAEALPPRVTAWMRQQIRRARCGCPDSPHVPRDAHPHVQPGCVGYPAYHLRQEEPA